MSNTIYQRVYNKHRKPIGVVLAQKNEAGGVGVGWSKACKGDTFEIGLGVKIATERASNGTRKQIPYELETDFNIMVSRATRYFKVNTVETFGA